MVYRRSKTNVKRNRRTRTSKRSNGNIRYRRRIEGKGMHAGSLKNQLPALRRKLSATKKWMMNSKKWMMNRLHTLRKKLSNRKGMRSSSETAKYVEEHNAILKRLKADGVTGTFDVKQFGRSSPFQYHHVLTHFGERNDPEKFDLFSKHPEERKEYSVRRGSTVHQDKSRRLHSNPAKEAKQMEEYLKSPRALQFSHVPSH